MGQAEAFAIICVPEITVINKSEAVSRSEGIPQNRTPPGGCM